jgi:DNA mismatch repair protein MutS2
MEKQLRKISRNRKALDEKLARIKNTDRTLENIAEKYEKELTDIQAVKKQLLAEAKREAQAIIEQANKKVEATIKEIREAQAEKERTKAARRELEEFNSTLEQENLSESDRKIEAKMNKLLERKKKKEERQQREARKGGTAADPVQPVATRVQTPGELKVGDKVKIKGGNLIGEVMQVGGSWVNVAVGSIISKVQKANVEHISNKEFSNAVKSLPKTMSSHSESLSERKLNFKPNIDIRGERLMEALEIVSRFIDDALMVGIGEVKILHGKGNGILKEEIRKYLRTVPGVVSCKDEDIQFGGSGITVVKLD